MKNISLIILIALFLSSCHLSLDFAKRKYRPGFYVNLSSKKANSNQPIAISNSKNLDKRIADLTPISQKRETISDNQQSSIIHQQSFSQTAPLYIRSEKRVVEDNSVVLNKLDNEEEVAGDGLTADEGGILIIIIALLSLGFLAIMVLLGLAKFTFIAFLLTFAITIVVLIIICVVAFLLFMGDISHPSASYGNPPKK
jgi:amino acid transporter